MTYRRPTWLCVIAIVAMAPAAVAPAEAGESARLAGTENSLWAVIIDVDKTYRVIRKPEDKAWTPVLALGSGRPTDLHATADGLTVFFADGEFVRYMPPRGLPIRGRKPPDALWPRGTALLAGWVSAQGDVSLLVRRPGQRGERTSRPRPATMPTTGPASTPVLTGTAPGDGPAGAEPAELALLTYAGGQWSGTPAPTVSLPPQWAALAHLGGTDYVLLADPPRLMAAADGPWQDIDLPEELRGARPLDLLAIDGQLVLAAFNHPAPGRLSLAAWSDGRWGPVRPLRRDDEPVTWPEEDPPAVAAMDGRVALLYARGERREWSLDFYDLDGARVAAPTPLAVRPDTAEQAGRVQQAFFLGVVVVLMLLILWPGQPARTGPFALPATLRPSPLLKRAVAFFVDMMPFSMLGWVAAGRPEPEHVAGPLAQGPSLQWVYAALGSIAAYTVYCIVMERLAGATLGKLMLRMRVVGDEGRRPTMREIALRNISKVPELMTVIPLVFMIFTRYRQRIGDKIAWTAVVEAAGEAPPPLPPDDASEPSDDRQQRPPEDQPPPKL